MLRRPALRKYNTRHPKGLARKSSGNTFRFSDEECPLSPTLMICSGVRTSGPTQQGWNGLMSPTLMICSGVRTVLASRSGYTLQGVADADDLFGREDSFR